jgi:hypothetical protein
MTCRHAQASVVVVTNRECGEVFDRNLSGRIDAIQKAIDTARQWPVGRARRAVLVILHE